MKLVLRRSGIGPLVALAATYILFVVLAPDSFARASNVVTMARQTAVVAIASVGMTFVIVHGGIDLSTGSAVALTTVLVASVLKANLGLLAAVAVGLVVPALLGFLVGVLVAWLRIAPFVITLGAMTILRGAAKGLAHEQKVDVDAHGLDSLLGPPPSWMLVPSGVWIAILVAVVAAGVLHRTPFGRHVYAIGSNERAARLSGIRVGPSRAVVYALAGLLSGLAGILEFSRLTVGDPTDSVGLELKVIAAVVIGGASLSGGEGTILGSMVGACLMTVIRTGSTDVGLPNWVQEIVTGAIIVLAVAVDRSRHERR